MPHASSNLVHTDAPRPVPCRADDRPRYNNTAATPAALMLLDDRWQTFHLSFSCAWELQPNHAIGREHDGVHMCGAHLTGSSRW